MCAGHAHPDPHRCKTKENKTMRKALLLTVLTVGLISLASSASAQLEATSLPDRIADPAPQGPATDTALVFTNLAPVAASVKFKAWNAAGEELATGEFEIPANGLVYVLASRLAEQAGIEGFVGHAEAKATGYVIGSTVIVGSRLTDVDTVNSHRVRRHRSRDVNATVTDPTTSTSRMVFPVVATY